MVLDTRRLDILDKKLAQCLSSPPKESSIPALTLSITLAATSQLLQPNLPPTSHAPLYLLHHLGTAVPLPPSLIFDGILAYPGYVSTLQAVVGYQIDKTQGFLSAFEGEVVRPLLKALEGPVEELERLGYMLLVVARAHSELAGLLLRQEHGLMDIQESYRRLSLPARSNPPTQIIQAKSYLLLLLHTMISPLAQTEREWKLGNLKEGSGSGKRPVRRVLLDAGLAEDYGFLFRGEGEGIEMREEEWRVLQMIAGEKEEGVVGGAEEGKSGGVGVADEVLQESRIESIQSLFPQLPAHLLIQALSHPRFSKPTTDTSDPGVEALTNALLDGTLPPELKQLGAVLRGEESGMEAESGGGGAEKKKYKRDNVWSDVPMDYSNLRVGKDDSQLPSLTVSIPDHIRASILRLTEQQEEEAEAERRAEREEAAARRAAKLAGAPVPVQARLAKPRTVAFEEELEEEEELEGRQMSRGVARDSEESDEGEDLVDGAPMEDTVDGKDPNTICEIAYIKDPKLFDRDAATRRTKARQDIRTQTGWSDEQIEGWKIMLDRDPRKEKKLSRHGLGTGNVNSSDMSFLPSNNNHRPREQPEGEGEGQGNYGGHDNRGGGRGRGDGRGGRGGGDGRGGGRGRPSHNSRGHQNATRSRGHDRKMRGGMGGGMGGF